MLIERDNLEVGVHRHHGVRDRLRLHALGGVHHEHGALACREAAADLVGEVNMARRVNQVELILLAVVGRVVHAHGLALDRNAALSFDIHAVEQLLGHIALRDRSR